MLGSAAGSALNQAWHLTGGFWRQTLTAFSRHPGIVLLYAAPAAAERVWVLLRTKPVPAWWLPSLEAVVILWRLLLCAAVLWIVLTPAQAASLHKTLTSNAMIQSKLSGFGQTLGQQLRLLCWEIVLYVGAFALLNFLLNSLARLWSGNSNSDLERRQNERIALASVARNLFLVPLALIYIAVVVRHVLART
ncbi:MAG TPA: hypothetical protein VFW25_05810 [Silvibacterium sp.]|nr:hypothetical protein [Silvibacterium sp.]